MALLALMRMTVADFARQPVTWLMTFVSLLLVGLSYLFGAPAAAAPVVAKY